ncbi:GFA family protein [Brevundimonas lutea]|uniref:GFA family protein n=1 Tax=Brevundimonas lutea TaxID=2293980 RepID=UPI000F0246AE|nr:GFA family protein [Brevundimonas lutea]
MQGNSKRFSGGCACGAVRFRARAEPLRVGLCHCLTCRRAHGAAFNPFVVFDAAAVEVTGSPRSWFSSPGYDRQFCDACGSRVIALNGDEVEISIGSLDEIGLLEPQYESWIVRREPWLSALDKPQHAHKRAP